MLSVSSGLQHWRTAGSRHCTAGLLYNKPTAASYLSSRHVLQAVHDVQQTPASSTSQPADPADRPTGIDSPSSSQGPQTARPNATSAPNSSTVAKAAFLGVTTVAAICCYSVLVNHQDELPKLPPWAGAAVPAVGLAVLLARQVSAFWSLGDFVHAELHRGHLYLQTGVPSQGPQIPPGAVVVRPTGDGRGNGAYAATLIPQDSRICEYEGELLTAAEYLQRYPDGVSDYAMSIDNDYVSDAAGLVADTSRFRAVHMNHSSKRANIVRFYERAQKRVTFFANRDIHPGEELLFDYGRNYWRGREHLELP